jgi:hypothetical protein
LVIARATPLANTSAAAITVNKRTTRRIQSAPFPASPTGAFAPRQQKPEAGATSENTCSKH